MDKHWLKSYPDGVPHEIKPEQYTSLTQLLEESFRKNASRPFSVCMERWMSYGELDNLSAALGASTRLPKDVRGLIEKFLGVAGDPDSAAVELRALAKDANMAIDPALDLFESRTGFFAARGVDVDNIRFSTAFGRGFDYYTGFVFELTDVLLREADIVLLMTPHSTYDLDNLAQSATLLFDARNAIGKPRPASVVTL